MSSVLTINERIAIPLAEVQWDVSRSGGPGGQNVNKVNSKVQLRWNPATNTSLPPAVRARLMNLVANRLTREGDILITSQLTRDQPRNVADCLAKLRALILSVAEPPTPRRPSRPTYSSQLRRLESKAKRSASKRSRRGPESD
ncbi:alternative ribosome rescue aminoacyl-tRNA hydrolase ArfB [Singulisphaera sp. PoT]|uniref:alternative ribosome rescue aminoacyl-tRNA hydrolase ArfB n=1 Tax=Singulisphaera sp. PoT TaxID=3411797 RepID=UPI003BF4C158